MKFSYIGEKRKKNATNSIFDVQITMQYHDILKI